MVVVPVVSLRVGIRLRSIWKPTEGRQTNGLWRGAVLVGGVALAIDAKDDRAARWYARFGALRLKDDPLKFVLPLDTIEAALGPLGTS